MGVKDKINEMKRNIKKSRLEREKIENEREKEEYIKRQERYNDMLRDEAQKQKFITNMNKIKINTYTKKMVAIILSFAILCIAASYVLAFLGRDNTLENLSIQLCITILGVSFVYMIRAYFDSKAEHKNLDNKIKEEIEEGLIGKFNDTLSAAGFNINMDNFFKGKPKNKREKYNEAEEDEDTDDNSDDSCEEEEDDEEDKSSIGLHYKGNNSSNSVG